MAPLLFIIAALLSATTAAPWRCYRTAAGDTVCFGPAPEPRLPPAEVCVARLPLPCVDQATVCTPSREYRYPYSALPVVAGY